jgi:hypothetical protein
MTSPDFDWVICISMARRVRFSLRAISGMFTSEFPCMSLRIFPEVCFGSGEFFDVILKP